MCTTNIALVFLVIFSSIFFGSILKVRGSTSTKIGVAPTYNIQLADATKENGVVITSSPRPMPAATMARCRPAVPLETVQAYFVPIFFANFFSNSTYFGPKLRWSVHKTLRIAFLPESAIHGFAIGYFFIKTVYNLGYSGKKDACSYANRSSFLPATKHSWRYFSKL